MLGGPICMDCEHFESVGDPGGLEWFGQCWIVDEPFRYWYAEACPRFTERDEDFPNHRSHKMEKIVTLIAFNDEKLVGKPFFDVVLQHVEILLSTKKRGDMLFVGWGLYVGKNEDDPNPMRRSFGEERLKGNQELEFQDLAEARGIRMRDDPRGYVEVGILRKPKEV